MGDPISATAAFAFLNSAFKLSEYAIKLYGVESENGLFVRMIHRVRLDLEETERLLSVPSVKEKLISIPGKLPWIKGVVISTKGSLNEIGRWAERVRAEKEGYGTVSFETRVRWVFNDQEKLVNRSMELRTSHQTLSTVLAYLTPLEQANTLLAPGPPAYDNVTFFDDFLSPRQRRRKVQYADKVHSQEKGVDRGISNRPTREPNSICPTPQPIEHNKFQGRELVKTSNTASSFQNSDPPMSSSWTSTSDRASVVSIAPPAAGSNLFPISNTTKSFPEPTAQERSPNYCEPVLFNIPTSGCVSSTSRNLFPLNPAVSSEPLSKPSSMSSVLAPADSPRYSGQAELPIESNPTISWTSPPPRDLASTFQEADATKFHRPLDAPSSPAHSQATSVAYSPPLFHTLVSPPTPLPDMTSLCIPTVYDQTIFPHQPSPSSMLPLPEQTINASAQHKFGTTNSTGPVDPYEIWAKPGPNLSLVGDGLLGGRLVSHSAEPFSPVDRPVSAQNPPRIPESSRTSDVPDNVAEMMGDLSVCHPQTHNSLASSSKVLLSTESQSNDSFKELLPCLSSWNPISTSRSEMPGDKVMKHDKWSALATELSAEPYFALKTSQNPPPDSAIDRISSSYTELPAIEVSQISRSRYQNPLSMESSSSQQPQTQSQSLMHHQSHHQYQPYRPPIPSPSPVFPISTPTPFPMLAQQNQQTNSNLVSPQTQPATSTQITTSTDELDHPISRSATVAETRRRNQKVLLALMDRGSYG